MFNSASAVVAVAVLINILRWFDVKQIKVQLGVLFQPMPPSGNRSGCGREVHDSLSLRTEQT